jgi:NB-ARC domain
MITKLNLDGSDHCLDVPAGDTDGQGTQPGLYSSIAGQIVVGRYVMHIGQPFGGVLEEASQAEHDSRARATPILQRPGLTRGFLDRRQELTDALSAVDAGLSIEVSGEPGVGKTAFLHLLAHHSGAAAFADGVVYISARHQSSADILQLIFEAFYENDQVRKPSEAEIRRGLEEKQALILLDDVQLPHDEMEQVLDVAPRSALALATRERCLLGEVRSVVLPGLPAREALMLLEREVGRPLSIAERSAAASICETIQGHPLRIRQTAAIIRERGIAIEVLARDVVPDNLITELMSTTDDKQRRALLALAALPGVPLPLQHIAGFAEVIDIDQSLAALVGRGLVVRSQSRHRLAEGVADHLRRTEDLKPWVNRAVTYFTAWAERNRRSPNTLLEESEALLRVQHCAVETQRSGEVLRLGRLVEGALIVGARWGAWAITLDRCLTAAKAMKDRSAEAWTLHEAGTRAVCLGDSMAARALLGQALKLRQTLDDDDAIAASRRNLSFVHAPVSIASRRPAPAPAPAPSRDPVDFDALPLRDQIQLPVHVPTRKRSGGAALLVVVVLIFAVLGGVGYWASRSGLSWQVFDVAGSRSVLQGSLAVATTDTPTAPPPAPPAAEPRVLRFTAFPDVIAQGESLGLCYEVVNGTGVRIDPDVGEVDPRRRNCVRVAPAETTTYMLTVQTAGGESVRQTVLVRVGLSGRTAASTSDRASVLIFTPRPGSISTGAPTALCYAVNGALHARIEPGVGDVSPSSALTCLRVTPSRTTTYELTALGRDSYPVRRQLVIVVR